MQVDLINEPITKGVLILLGYYYHNIFKYYCPPPPADGSTYRLEIKSDGFRERCRAFLGGHEDRPTIKWLDTIGQLNSFHEGMCGKKLL